MVRVFKWKKQEQFLYKFELIYESLLNDKTLK